MSATKARMISVKSGNMPEWDSNDSSSVCMLCTAAFSIFRNRRHHCRQCGRLVCENCSTRKMKLENSHTKEPQRVCDPCFLMLTKKEEKKIEYVSKNDKNVELLMSTSFISESLMDVYFLDGSYKTICYDDATIVSELTESICFSVKVALFEVLQDINDPAQYKMIKPTMLITEIFENWKASKLKYAKIVLPLYDLMSSYPDLSRDNYKSALRRVMPSAPLDHGVNSLIIPSGGGWGSGVNGGFDGGATSISSTGQGGVSAEDAVRHSNQSFSSTDAKVDIINLQRGTSGGSVQSNGGNVGVGASTTAAATATAQQQVISDRARFASCDDDDNCETDVLTVTTQTQTQTQAPQLSPTSLLSTPVGSISSYAPFGSPSRSPKQQNHNHNNHHHSHHNNRNSLFRPPSLSNMSSGSGNGGVNGGANNNNNSNNNNNNTGNVYEASLAAVRDAAEMKRMKMEVDALTAKLDKANKQNDMLRALCLKNGRATADSAFTDTQQHHQINTNFTTTGSSGSGGGGGDHNNNSSSHTTQGGVVKDHKDNSGTAAASSTTTDGSAGRGLKKSDKRSSFSWSSIGFSNTGSRSTSNPSTPKASKTTGTGTATTTTTTITATTPAATPVRDMSTSASFSTVTSSGMVVSGGNSAILTSPSGHSTSTAPNGTVGDRGSLRKSTSSATFTALQNNANNNNSNNNNTSRSSLSGLNVAGSGNTLGSASGGASGTSVSAVVLSRQQSLSSVYSLQSGFGSHLSVCSSDDDSSNISISTSGTQHHLNQQQQNQLSQYQTAALDTDTLVTNPLKVLTLDDSAFTLFVRTYYHKISELELFCNRYDKIFNTILSQDSITSSDGVNENCTSTVDNHNPVMPAVTTITAAATGLIRNSNNNADFAGNNNNDNTTQYATDTDNTATTAIFTTAAAGISTPAGGATRPLAGRSIVHVYHMVVAIDSVYEFVMSDFEAWRSNLKEWLLRIFSDSIKLPILQPDTLQSVIYCLCKEQLILDPTVVDIVKTTIESCLEAGVDNARTVGRETLLVTPHSNNSGMGGNKELLSLQQQETFARTNSSSSSSGASQNLLRGSLANLNTSMNNISFTKNNNSNNNGSGSGNGSSNSNSTRYNFAVVTQYMQNILQTFTYIVADLIPIIPSEILVTAMYLTRTQRIIKEQIKLCYYTHKHIMPNDELIAIYKFLDSLIKSFTKFGIDKSVSIDAKAVSGTDKSVVDNLSDFMADVFKQYHACTVSTMSAAVNRIQATDERFLSTFQQRPMPEDTTDYTIGYVSNNSNSNNSNSNNSPYGTGSVSNTTRDDSAGREYVTVWSSELSALVRTQLQLIPSDIACNIKVYLCLQILDSLTDFNTKQESWLKNMSSTPITPPHLLDKVCVYVNNHLDFVCKLTDTVESWVYDDDIDDIHLARIGDKLETTLTLFRDSVTSGSEILSRYVYTDIRDILKHEKHGLFVKSWHNSVKSITLLKGCLRKHLGFICTNISSDYYGGAEAKQKIVLYACEAVISVYIETLLSCPTLCVALTESSAATSSTGTNSSTLERLMEDCEMLTKLFEELRTTRCVEEGSALHRSQQPIVYTSSSGSGNNNKDKNNSGDDGTGKGRRFFFSRRRGGNQRQSDVDTKKSKSFSANSNIVTSGTIAAADNSNNNIKIISNGNTSGSGGGVGAMNTYRYDDNEDDSSSQVDGSSGLPQSPQQRSLSRSYSISSSQSTAQQQQLQQQQSSNNKAQFDTILKPLTHIILACQMDITYIVDFVKNELYADFGPDCVRVWQLIMQWRGESILDTRRIYETHFMLWEPRSSPSSSSSYSEPLMELPYLDKLKHITFFEPVIAGIHNNSSSGNSGNMGSKDKYADV